jgi:hypothetical protein
MFKIITSPEFTHPIAVMVPTDGGHEEQTFKARFRVFPSEKDGEYDLTSPTDLKEYLREVVVSMDDLIGDDKKPVPYSDAVREQMIGLPYVRLELLRTYMAAVTKQRTGN